MGLSWVVFARSDLFWVVLTGFGSLLAVLGQFSFPLFAVFGFFLVVLGQFKSLFGSVWFVSAHFCLFWIVLISCQKVNVSYIKLIYFLLTNMRRTIK